MAGYTYWSGAARAWVSTSTVCAPFQNTKSVTFINKVFETWYKDMNACTNQNNTAAKDTLKSMGRTAGFWTRVPAGLFISVKDLEDCFDHFDSNGKKWRDSNVWHYNGGFFGAGLTSDVPWAMVTFAEAYDANLDKIKDYVAKQQEQLALMKKGVKGPKIKWKEINDPLTKFDEYTKAIDPLLVMCPEAVMKGTRYTWAKNVAKCTGAANDWLQATEKTGSVQTATALTALTVILSECVPIFGSLYAEALKGVPNAISFFENIKWERDNTLAKFGKEYMIYR